MNSYGRTGWLATGLGVLLSSYGCASKDAAGDATGGVGGTYKSNSNTFSTTAVVSGGTSSANASGSATGGAANSSASTTSASGGSLVHASGTGFGGTGFGSTGGGTGGGSSSSAPAGGRVSVGGTTPGGGRIAVGGVTSANGGALVGGATSVAGGKVSSAGTGKGGATHSGGFAGSVAVGGGGISNAGSGNCPATSDFAAWPSGKGPDEIGKLAVNNFGPHTGDSYDGAGYAWTFAYFGSLQLTKLLGDKTTNDQLIQDFEPYANGTKPPPDNSTSATVDDRAFGDLPLEIFIENGDTRCKTLGLARADAQWAGAGSDGLMPNPRYWIDDMFMVTGLQVFAYRATGNSMYLNRAANEMLVYVAALQQSDGLFWHTKQSKAYWGRANGWVASGMTELLLDLPSGATRDSVMAAYKKQMDALVANQITSGTDAGCWRQVLDVSKAAAESSCTAMFTYALVTGVKNGWLTDTKYVTAARNGWIALGKKTNGSGMLDQVCPGTDQAPAGDLASQQQYYMAKILASNDQHGQAPLLWAARALLRTDCPGKR